MTRNVGLIMVLALLMASTAVDAQLRGLIKKKAAEVLTKKPEAPPAPAPAPAPTPETTTTPAAPAAAPARTGADPVAEKKAAGSPLDVSALPLRQSAVAVLRGNGEPRANGDWDELPSIPAAATAAAYGLSEAAQVTLVETVGAALKALVMSAPFQAEHDASIKNEHQAVDHGLKGIIGFADAMKKNDLKAVEAIQLREVVAMGVEQVRIVPPDALKQAFTEDLADWNKRAADPKRRDRAKYQKLVATAKPLEALPANDLKFLNGYAVLKSIDNDGPDTEAAVLAIHKRVQDEKEQVAWDEHYLKGRLKQHLTAFVAVASKVNFNAPTVEKSGRTMFVNAADEKQGAMWKACFRAGEAPTAAALKLAKAWLLEL
jgi:hypothetical protein